MTGPEGGKAASLPTLLMTLNVDLVLDLRQQTTPQSPQASYRHSIDSDKERVTDPTHA